MIRRRARQRAAIPLARETQPREERPKPALVAKPPQLMTPEEEAAQRTVYRQIHVSMTGHWKWCEALFVHSLYAALPHLRDGYFPSLRLTQRETYRLLYYLRLYTRTLDISGKPTIDECLTAFCLALGVSKHYRYVTFLYT